MGKKVLVSVINDLNTDQRVHKVCLFIQAQGYSVKLIGRKKSDSLPMEPRPYTTKRMNMYFEKGALFYAWFNFRLFWILLFSKADIFLANDLDTLLPNYLASKLRRKKLVYDSHEYFTEVPELTSRPKTQAIWERIERSIFPKLKQVYTVNASIAQKYTEKYNVPTSVVRNVSPLWKPTQLKSKEELGLPTDCALMIMQGAGLNINRGVEEAISMMPYVPNACLILVGDGDVIPAMKKYVSENNLGDRVLFFGKRPYAELMNFTYHADLGLSFDQPTNDNYLFSLPNKVFDYLHTETPIICSNVVEVAKLVSQYNIGRVITDFSPKHLGETLSEILKNTVLLSEWKANCKAVALQENWEHESQTLAQFYPKVEH